MQDFLYERKINKYKNKKVDRIIIAWDPGCLGTLPGKLPASLKQKAETEIKNIKIYDGKETIINNRSIFLRGGVYIQDRLSETKKNIYKNIFTGRYIALWVIARALGMHAKLGFSILGCIGSCREKLRKKYIEGRVMKAEFYTTVNTDILRIRSEIDQVNPKP